MQGGRSSLGRLTSPELVDEAITRHDLVRVDEKDCEKRPLPTPTERDFLAVSQDLERAEKPKFERCVDDLVRGANVPRLTPRAACPSGVSRSAASRSAPLAPAASVVAT